MVPQPPDSWLVPAPEKPLSDLAQAIGVDRAQADTRFLPPHLRSRVEGFLSVGKFAWAIKTLRDDYEKNPGNLRTIFLMAFLYEAEGYPNRARNLYAAARAQELSEEDARRVFLARLRIRLRDQDEAGVRDLLEAEITKARLAVKRADASSKPRLASALALRALLAYRRGQQVRTRALLDEALEHAPDHLAIRSLSILAHAETPIRIQHAATIGAFLEDLERVPSPTDPIRARAARQMKGRIRAEYFDSLEEDGEDAWAFARRHPTDPWLQLAQGHLHRKRRRFQAAFESFQKARKGFDEGPMQDWARELESEAQVRAEVEAAKKIPLEVVQKEEAELILNQPRFQEAGRIYRRILRRIDAERFDDAFELLKEAQRTWPEVVEFPLQIGHHWTRLGNFRRAQAAYLEALKLDEHRAESHALVALSILARGEAGPGPSRALRYAQEASRLDPDALSLHALGWAMVALGDVRDGAQKLHQAAKLKPEDASIRYRLGLALLALDLEAPALAEFEAAQAYQPDHPRNLLMRGVALARMGRRDEAIDALSQAAQRGPAKERKIAEHTLARLTGSVRERDPSQREDVPRPAPGIPSPRESLVVTSSEVAHRLGPAFDRYLAAARRVAEGHVDEGKGDLRSLKEEQPGMAEPIFALSVLSLIDGELEATRAANDLHLDLRPSDPRGAVVRAFHALMASEPKTLALALTAFRQAPADLPDDPFLGVLAGRWDRELEVNPYRPESHYHRGVLRIFQGDLKGAEMDFEAAGKSPESLRATALVQMLRFARTGDEDAWKGAEPLLRKVGPSPVARAMDAIRREILRVDEVAAKAPAKEWTWDKACATKYVQVSPMIRSMVYGLPLSRVDARRMGLRKSVWEKVDRSLIRTGNALKGTVELAQDPSHELDYAVLAGEKKPLAEVPMAPHSQVPFNLPLDPILEEGIFDEEGDLQPIPELEELAPLPANEPEARLGEVRNEADGIDGDPGLDGLDDLDSGLSGDLDFGGDLDPGGDFEDLGGFENRSARPSPTRSLRELSPQPPPPPPAPHPPRSASSPTEVPVSPELLVAWQEAVRPIASGRTDQTRIRLELLAQKYPEHPGPLRDLAMLDWAEGRIEEAVDRARLGLRSFPHEGVFYRLGAIFKLQGGEVDRARELLQKADREARGQVSESLYREAAGAAWLRWEERTGRDETTRVPVARLAFWVGDLAAARKSLDGIEGEECEALRAWIELGSSGDQAQASGEREVQGG